MVKINLCKELAGPSIPVIGAVVLWGLCATSAVADAIYKSTDDRGHVTYSDKVVSKNYEILDFPTKGWVDRTKSRASSNLAYTLKRREELHPVVAYASREYDLSPELLH